MKYNQSKRMFMSRGADVQKSPDISFDVKRISDEAMQSWSKEQKKNAREFMKTNDAVYKAFRKEILKYCK
jgi:ATP-dependent Zn protease